MAGKAEAAAKVVDKAAKAVESAGKFTQLGGMADDAIGTLYNRWKDKGPEFLETVMGGYWDRMGAAPAKGTYEALTDLRRGKTPDFAQTKVPNPEQPNWKKKVQGPKLGGVPAQVRSGRYPEDVADIHPFFNPERVTHDPTRHTEYTTRFMGKAPEDHKWAQFFYDHPVATAEAVGATTAVAPLLAAGAFLQNFAQGSKPRSDYAYPVEPYRGGYDDNQGVPASSNEYNPSVESARAAARAREDLEILKQQHKKELIEMRGESRTPGVQGGGSFDVMGSLNNIYGNRQTNYFK